MKGPRWFDGNMRIANLPDAGSLPAGTTNVNHIKKEILQWNSVTGSQSSEQSPPLSSQWRSRRRKIKSTTCESSYTHKQQKRNLHKQHQQQKKENILWVKKSGSPSSEEFLQSSLRGSTAMPSRSKAKTNRREEDAPCDTSLFTPVLWTFPLLCLRHQYQ